MTTFQICFVILNIHATIQIGTNTTNRRCETKLGNGSIKVHCCDNQEAKNGLCVECKIGFISDMGEPCQPCRTGVYGRKCGDYCTCNSYEMCNHVVGCLNSTYVTSTELISGSGRTENANTAPGKIVPIKLEMIIYIICTSGITFVITMCLVTLKRHRKRKMRNIIKKQAGEIEKHEDNATTSNQAHYYDERHYDTIDESQMIDMPPQHLNIIVDSSLTKDELELSDGYLNPYQPMVPDPVMHDYSKANPVEETNLPKYINLLGEHRSLLIIPQSNKTTLNSSVQNALASSFRDNALHLQRSDYISMHQNDLLSTGLNLSMECSTETLTSNEIDEA